MPYKDAEKQKEARRKYKKSRSPYWNFWKVIFAGWLIRYPRQCFTFFGGTIGFLIVLIYNALR